MGLLAGVPWWFRATVFTKYEEAMRMTQDSSR